LGPGSVIHATHHEQDMRNYGGLRKKIPLTFWAMMIGTLAITGVGIPLTHYGFAGFLSKDAVIESAWVGSSFAFWLLVVAACMTSFYSWRLMFLTFFGTSRAHGHDDHGHDAHGTTTTGTMSRTKAPPMLIPLGVLALGAAFSGMIWYNSFFGDEAKMRDLVRDGAAAEHGEAATEEAAATTEATATEAAPTEEATTEGTVARPRRQQPRAIIPPWSPGPPKGAIFMGPDNHRDPRGARRADLGQGLALHRHADRLSRWPGCSTSRIPACRAVWPRSSVRCTCSC
jgi:NADH-quinone oxidoreductase subunit L